MEWEEPGRLSSAIGSASFWLYALERVSQLGVSEIMWQRNWAGTLRVLLALGTHRHQVQPDTPSPAPLQVVLLFGRFMCVCRWQVSPQDYGGC